MRLVTAIVLLGTASIGLTAQAAPDLKVALLQNGKEVAAVWAHGTAPYQGGPWAGVPALPSKEAGTPTGTSFRVRSWNEDAQARVVVFAVEPDATAAKGERETQIATFLLPVGGSRAVIETAKYQAAPITITVARVPVKR